MITATFTDPQGTLQTNALLQLRTANYYSTTNEFYVLDPNNLTTVNNPPATVVINVNFSYYYWTSQAAKDAGAAQYPLANKSEMDTDFSFTPDVTYDGLTLKEKCEKYLIDVILPPMQA
jgi:hypothetical protein